MKLTCLIADDEYLALRILAQYIQANPSLELLAQCKDPATAWAFLEKNQVDLLLLDIQMPGMTGIELVRKLSYQPLVIFTTARHDYAVEAFELEALDYLVKPISPERFQKAIQKALQYAAQRAKPPAPVPASYLSIKADYRVVQIPFNDILYIEGLSEYVKIYTPVKKYITLAALKDIEQQLPALEFIRIHKSYLLAKRQIASYNTTSVILQSGTALPVGRKYKDDFIQAMQPPGKQA